MRLKTLAAALAIMLLMTLTGCAPRNPHQRGPNPTDDLLNARVGPYTTTSFTVADADTPGFGAATIYHPTTEADGRFGGVAIAPGYTESQAAISWLGPFLSSHGFVVITIDTNGIFDFPWDRATQLLAALDYLTQTSAARNRVDSGRLAVSGHSMGGGGALEAARTRTSLKAAIPLTHWHPETNWSGNTTPTLIIAAENDTIADADTFAKPSYQGLPGNLPKAYLEMAGADHFVTNSYNQTVARQMVSWLKRFVDDDTRYAPFLCPPPPATGPVSESLSTCPYS